MSQDRRLRQRQVIALIVFVIWALLLAVGLFGQNFAIPRAVTVPAGLVAVIAAAFLIPGSALYGLLHDRAVGRSTSRQMWIAWRWRFAIGGTCMAVIASGLLLPATRVRFEIRVGGIVALIWALLCIWVAVLAFQAKLESQVLKGGPAEKIWRGAYWARVLLITLAVIAAWLVLLVVTNSRLN